MLIVPIKSTKKFEHKQQIFSVALHFNPSSSLTLVLAQPCKRWNRLSRGFDASQQVVETGSSAWSAGEGRKPSELVLLSYLLLGLLAPCSAASRPKLPHTHRIVLNLMCMRIY